MSKHNVVVIGNGMVGHRFIEELLEKAEPDQFSLTVFCEEPRVAYDRVHLSAYFSHHTAEELSLVREGYYDKHQVNLLLGERAITINRDEKLIHSSTGRAVHYDTLILPPALIRGSRQLTVPKAATALSIAPSKISTPSKPVRAAANAAR